MLKKIGSLILVVMLTGCGSAPERASYTSISLDNADLKVDVPDYPAYTVKGLKSVECADGKCTMTELDFRQNQHDKRALWEMYNLNQKIDAARVNAYNTLIDAQSYNQLAIERKKEEVYNLEQALKEERTFNAMKTWMERLLFIGGAFIFGSL